MRNPKNLRLPVFHLRKVDKTFPQVFKRWIRKKPQQLESRRWYQPHRKRTKSLISWRWDTFRRFSAFFGLLMGLLSGANLLLVLGRVKWKSYEWNHWFRCDLFIPWLLLVPKTFPKGSRLKPRNGHQQTCQEHVITKRLPEYFCWKFALGFWSDYSNLTRPGPPKLAFRFREMGPRHI